MLLPLDGVRVLDLTDGLGESCGRYLADLGAHVVRAEPVRGSASRQAEPRVEGISIPFALRNANKLAVTADPSTESGRERLAELIAGADIVIESFAPGTLAGYGLAADRFRAERPELVWVSITGFGSNGPYADWTATEPVLYALSGALSRSGAPDAPPLLPPAGLVEEAVGAHAAWSAVLAYYRRIRCGQGEFVDLSALEVMVHGFDPGFGTQGSAAAGRAEDFPRNRPNAANFYPVFACADGYVRICLLAKRQWRAMFEWLGSPEEFADPKYDTIPGRFAAADRLHPLIGRLFAGLTRNELVAEGAARGIPLGGLHDIAEVLTQPHFVESGALIDAELAPGLSARVPSGYLSIDGARAGIRLPAPVAGEHDGLVDPWCDVRMPAAAGHNGPTGRTREGTSPQAADRPLTGLRVLDLGVIVFGAELSRQLADYGADVVKIENATFPDGLRQTKRGAKLAASVAWGHRNKRSLGLDLRSPEGLALFRALAEDADVVLANFKPGTLASMGLAPRELLALNPRLVISESSAFGGSGRWSNRLGYGPLVRASCGVSALWRYPHDPELLCDGMTVYPDHIAAQVAAAAVLAALVRRERTGRGAVIDIAQADTALVQLGVQLTLESLRPGSVVATGNADPHHAPSGVYACAGDDEWCAVTVRSDRAWAAVCELAGAPELADDPRFATAAARIEHRAEADRVLADWLARLRPTEAMQRLQEAGVPAGAMLRLPELLTDPHLKDRRSFAWLSHDLMPAPLPTATSVGHFAHIAEPPLRQAPVAGEHTRQICRDELGLSDERIDELVEAGVLQPPAATT
ncbi:CaiB/BaiF CoA transferase family protein [Nocardia higoensis]|uniref:CaiB/BaiF CoA transferase family protein n=1 Tax=Nocardia higoensis TaxID=228599 RepID=UPI000593ED7F|nr:CoA transferase [Nocardia higoensis]